LTERFGSSVLRQRSRRGEGCKGRSFCEGHFGGSAHVSTTEQHDGARALRGDSTARAPSCIAPSRRLHFVFSNASLLTLVKDGGRVRGYGHGRECGRGCGHGLGRPPEFHQRLRRRAPVPTTATGAAAAPPRPGATTTTTATAAAASGVRAGARQPLGAASSYDAAPAAAAALPAPAAATAPAAAAAAGSSGPCGWPEATGALLRCGSTGVTHFDFDTSLFYCALVRVL
jgi:hypothetical protein